MLPPEPEPESAGLWNQVPWAGKTPDYSHLQLKANVARCSLGSWPVLTVLPNPKLIMPLFLDLACIPNLVWPSLFFISGPPRSWGWNQWALSANLWIWLPEGQCACTSAAMHTETMLQKKKRSSSLYGTWHMAASPSTAFFLCYCLWMCTTYIAVQIGKSPQKKNLCRIPKVSSVQFGKDNQVIWGRLSEEEHFWNIPMWNAVLKSAA